MKPRQRPTREQLLARLPITRAVAPLLDRQQLTKLSLAHNANLDIISRGEATIDLLWQHMGGVLTWHYVAQALGMGEPEMAEQVDLCVSMLDRYQRTGSVGVSDLELETARDGVVVFDQLAAAVDQATAVQAVIWSEQRLLEAQQAAARTLHDAPSTPQPMEDHPHAYPTA